MATETLNLSDSGDGMVPIGQPENSYMPEPPPVQNKQPEKNVSREHIKMDSTTLSDIMTSQEVMEQQPMMMAPPQNTMMAQQPMMMAPQQQAPAQAQQALPSKNPFNLTDEQIQALVVAVCAAIAFSEPVQAKLGSTIPQFLAESGNRSMIGLLISGLVAAILFYFGQRTVMKA